MPHFDHFPRPGEIDPCGRHGLCNNVAKKHVLMHRNTNILYIHRIFLFCVLKGYILSRISGRGRLNVNTKMGGMYLSLFSQPNIRDYMGNL